MTATASEVTIGVSILALIGQVLNGWFYLRIRNAILENQLKAERWVDEEFVRKETCQAIHHGSAAARATK